MALGTFPLTEDERQALYDKFGQRSLECPVCLDQASTQLCMSLCGHGPFCRGCITNALRTQKDSGLDTTCPICRRWLTLAMVYKVKDLCPKETATMPSEDDLTQQLQSSLPEAPVEEVPYSTKFSSLIS